MLIGLLPASDLPRSRLTWYCPSINSSVLTITTSCKCFNSFVNTVLPSISATGRPVSKAILLIFIRFYSARYKILIVKITKILSVAEPCWIVSHPFCILYSVFCLLFPNPFNPNRVITRTEPKSSYNVSKISSSLKKKQLSW